MDPFHKPEYLQLVWFTGVNCSPLRYITSWCLDILHFSRPQQCFIFHAHAMSISGLLAPAPRTHSTPTLEPLTKRIQNHYWGPSYILKCIPNGAFGVTSRRGKVWHFLQASYFIHKIIRSQRKKLARNLCHPWFSAQAPLYFCNTSQSAEFWVGGKIGATMGP